MRNLVEFKSVSTLAMPSLLTWTVWFLVPPIVADVWAGDVTPVPTWRQGISQWNGQGYNGLSSALPQPVISLPGPSPNTTPYRESTPYPNSTPYTVPVDPAAQPKSNPYFDLPKSSSIPGEVSLPTVIPGPKTEFVLPEVGNSLASTGGRPAVEKSLNVPLINSNSGTSPKSTPVEDEDETKPLPAPTDTEKKQAGADAANSPDEERIQAKISKSDAAIEPAPLEAEVVRWYQYPRQWMKGWDSHAEFGLDGSDGNSDTIAYQVGIATKRVTKQHTLGMNLNYRNASSSDVTTEDNGRFNLDYDYLFKESSWSGFGKYGMEWDKFKAFDLRLWLNGGLGYYWFRDDDTTLVTRFGAGASKEIGAPVDDWVPEAVFGVEAERQLTARQKLKGRVDYFPAWEDFSDYRLVSDFAWEILLDGSENMSLRLAATDRYDSTPQGADPNDVYYSLLLLYKF